MTDKSIAKTALDFINRLFIERDNNNSILDPLTCVIRLSLLSFKETGTKISIQNNRIGYNEPNVLQGATRWSFGDKREDLHNIYNPIKKIIHWYNLNNKEIYGICEYCIKGLELLNSSYDNNSIINHTLTHYIKELEDALNDIDFKSKKYESNIYNNIEESTNVLYKSFKTLWNKREIIIIYNILLEMTDAKENENEEKLDSLMNSLDCILNTKEDIINKVITETSTIL
tara:strand:+ start:5237 stop:5923 length:687 start_codon:yes stop_codon:yes gene_type:complete